MDKLLRRSNKKRSSIERRTFNAKPIVTANIRCWLSRKKKNLSGTNGSYISREKVFDCKNVFIKSVSLRHPSGYTFYGLLVAVATLNLAACPFAIFLNALVMVAVKTKRRLQTHPNIPLAYLALTDLMVGLVVQPLHITKTIFLLQVKDFCDIDLAFTFSLVISSWASVSPLGFNRRKNQTTTSNTS